MKFENTECRICGTKESPIFARQPMRDDKDYICGDCKAQGKELEDI